MNNSTPNTTSHSGTPPGKTLVERAVARLEAESIRFLNSECRSIIRKPFVRPCSLIVRGTVEAVKATSQYIADSGINLIGQTNFSEGLVALLKIHSLEGSPVFFLAECRWCRPYGEEWFCSGWHFISIQRGNETSTKPR
ncbi:MAG: hypothetical protein KF851_20090 [Pirellulaceae bacterium]|jgi:hypothetical protein|nr:hypothetical protein [Pirellulaceae bacterium]